jgi:hypothetical protein
MHIYIYYNPIICIYIYITYRSMLPYILISCVTWCNPWCPAPFCWQELMEDTSEFFVETLKAAFADRRCWRIWRRGRVGR